MIIYLQSRGKRVTIGKRGELSWSKGLGLGRYPMTGEPWFLQDPGERGH